VLGAEQVARENVQSAQEVLRKVPGVYHASFNQGIISGEVGIRGFNTESDVASTKLVVDGIPTNLNSGLGEFNALFPLEIERVEIVRGTNDPRWGLFNLAGNVGVTTRRGGSYLAARALGGSFGTREAQLVAAREHALGRDGAGGTLSHTWFGGVRASDGFRANSALDRRAGSGKLFWTSAGERLSAGVIARVQALDTDAPGYLTAAEASAAPRRSPAFSDADGGTVDTRQASAHVEVRQTPTLFWSARLYAQRFARVRWVRFSAAGPQQERVEDERQEGALVQATWRPAAFAARQAALSLGADWQGQDNVHQRFRAADRVREATLRDQAFTFANGGGFARADATFGPLRVDAGLRLDRVGGDFRNVTTGEALPVIRYGWIPQPKASATLAVERRASVYANYGRGFQVGTGPAAYGRPALGGPPLTWSRNDGWEAGAVLQPLPAWSLRAGAWRQDASDEVRLRFDNSGDSENVGRTRRTGVDVESTVRLPRALSVWGALTTQRAILVEPGARTPELRGNRLNHVPGWTAKYGADWTPASRVSASFWAYGQGSYFLTPRNEAPRFGGYTAVNADLSLRVGQGVGVGLAVQNLFDRYFEYVWLDGTQTRHSPANPRALLLTMRLDR
jgi:iron complex outermembrane receptor protein